MERDSFLSVLSCYFYSTLGAIIRIIMFNMMPCLGEELTALMLTGNVAPTMCVNELVSTAHL